MKVEPSAKDPQLKDLDIALNELIEFYERKPALDVMVYPLWDTKDILGHLVYWFESCARNVHDLAHKKVPTPLQGTMQEINQRSVQETRQASVDDLCVRLRSAQRKISRHIRSPRITVIPYRKYARPYTPSEHLEVLAYHVRYHLKALYKAHKSVHS